MPDEMQSESLRKFRTSFPHDRFELQTLQLQQRRLNIADQLDIVFVMDTSGSMDGQLATVADSLAQVASEIASQFTSVRYAVISFESAVVHVTGLDFVNLATAQSALNGLTTSGGDETGFSALYAAAKMPWREEAAKAVILISDEPNTVAGVSYQTCKTELLRKDCVLFSGINLNDPDSPPYYGYDSLVLATGGVRLTGETSEALTAEIVQVLKGLAEPVSPPIYLVNDSVPFVAMLETGVEKTFENRSFEINTNISGEDGALSISLTIDNTDFAVSRYLAKARKFRIPLEVVLRIYFNDDPSEPQNEPVRLFATDFETKGSTVSCQVRWLDLQNSPFPDAFYSEQRCPSLQ